jgi:hypothetical protein
MRIAAPWDSPGCIARERLSNQLTSSACLPLVRLVSPPLRRSANNLLPIAAAAQHPTQGSMT